MNTVERIREYAKRLSVYAPSQGGIILALCDVVEDYASFREQTIHDLKQAHYELMKAQGATDEQAGNLEWPEWTPQANTIRWAKNPTSISALTTKVNSILGEE